MYKYAVSFVNQAYTNIRDNTIPSKSNTDANSIQATFSGSGEVYANDLYTNIRDNTIPSKSNTDANSIQATFSGSGEVYANDLKEARVDANEKFVDKTIKNIMQEKNSGGFYA